MTYNNPGTGGGDPQYQQPDGAYPVESQGMAPGMQPGMAPASAAPSSRLVSSAAIQIVGGVIGIISVFLAWLTISANGFSIKINGLGSVSGAPEGISTDGISSAGHGVRIIVLAALAIIGGIVVLVTKKLATVAMGVVGGIGLIVQALYDYFGNKSDMDSLRAQGADVSFGIGLWAALIGGVIVLIGAVPLVLAGRKKV